MVTASYGHYDQHSDRIVLDRISAGSHFLHLFRFRSSKEGPDQIVQNRPGSDLDGLDRFWPNASGLEGVRCARIIWTGSGKTQPAFLLSDSVAYFHRWPGSYCAMPGWIGFGSSWCARITRHASGNASEPIRTG